MDGLSLGVVRVEAFDSSRLPGMCCFPLDYPAKRGCIGRDAEVGVYGRAVKVSRLVFGSY